MAETEKSKTRTAAASVPGSSSTSAHLETGNGKGSRASTHHELDIEDYFKGPRDLYHHSKWPYFLRLHGSILPKMIIPLTFVGAWASAITLIHKLVYPIGIESLLLTVTGFVVGLALSFRSSTAYERYTEGRKYWSQLGLTSRNLARIIWINTRERHEESAELGKADLLSKLAALNLINAFAVSLKHRLRFEPSTDYPDLAPLLCNVRTLAGEADQSALQQRKASAMKAAGVYLGLTFAESNPRKVIKQSKENLGNTPLEVLSYLAAYIENIMVNETLKISVHQVQAGNAMVSLTDVLTGVERVVNTPLPVAYSISIAQITLAYVMALPFQLVEGLGWVTIPGTIVAGYIILGLAQIGYELENPFGQDVNDLPLDEYCQELANDIDALTSQPPPLNNAEWMRDGGAKVMWPLSNLEYRAWEEKSVEEIRSSLKAKATSRDVKIQRAGTFYESGTMEKES
ncbi:hypothetical protein LTR37_011584 [Vermiconidia calcicola]|uniref:Uncharacterized protein n=1 Tax=Vermiconidia calcicola TaxID=1690605 RepID=A0ACC3N2X1_9PEZI|nr:hypothetical protein LTR37_011584 [Vermiconidia calcicola]